MGTSAKKRRKYIKKFDTILPFLRLMVYGCYHRNQFKALGISGGVYDDCLRVIRKKHRPCCLRSVLARIQCPSRCPAGSWSGRCVTCVPGRRRCGTETFLVNQMMKVKPSSGKTAIPQEMPSISRKGHICLRLHGDAQTREKTSEEIRKQCRSVVFHEDGTCEMHVEDVRRYLPWLRSLSPQVEILPSSSGDLRDRMKNQLKEALAHYGIVR